MIFSDQEMLPVLRELGAVITDSHIVYTSGKHGSAYINKDGVYPHVATTSRFCETIAERCKHLDIETVIAPAVGAIILSQWTAHHLSAIVGKEIHAVYAEKSDDQSFVIKRGYDKFVTGRKVLVVEDILNTGGSAKKVVDVVRSIGGEVTGVAVLCNRGGVTAQNLGDVPELISLVNVQMDAWDEKDCPLCEQNIPINTEVGKGREYLTQK